MSTALTTFKLIGSQFNLNDDMIHKLSEIYIEDCNSYENTIKYYNNRNRIYLGTDFHNHRVKMDLVNTEFNYCLNIYINNKHTNYTNLLFRIFEISVKYNLTLIDKYLKKDGLKDFVLHIKNILYVKNSRY